MKEKFFIEFGGRQVDAKELSDRVRENWKAEGKLVKDLKTLNLYLKPEENKLYAVVNGEDYGSYEI